MNLVKNLYDNSFIEILTLIRACPGYHYSYVPQTNVEIASLTKQKTLKMKINEDIIIP